MTRVGRLNFLLHITLTALRHFAYLKPAPCIYSGSKLGRTGARCTRTTIREEQDAPLNCLFPKRKKALAGWLPCRKDNGAFYLYRRGAGMCSQVLAARMKKTYIYIYICVCIYAYMRSYVFSFTDVMSPASAKAASAVNIRR